MLVFVPYTGPKSHKSNVAGISPKFYCPIANNYHMIMKRRGILAMACTASASLFAGCGSTIEHSPAEDPWRDTEENEEYNSESLSGTVVLPEGRYAIRGFQPTRTIEVELSVSVLSGSNMDVYTMESSEFERYRDREEFLLIQDLSVDNTDDATLTSDVNSGDYTIAFDNSGFTGASPDGEIRAEFEITLSV